MNRRTYTATAASLIPLWSTTNIETDRGHGSPMNTDNSSSRSRDRDDPDGPSLTVSFADQFHPDEVYAGRAEQVPITLSNHSETVVSERVTLGVFYGQELLSGTFTVPANESREYTALWEVSDTQHRSRNQLYLNGESDSENVRITIQTPVSIRALNAVPDTATVGEELPVRFTLEINTESPGPAETDVTVSHHLASAVEDPSQAPESHSILHEKTHTVGGATGGTRSTTVAFSYTPTQTGHHVLRFENEHSETSLSVTVSE